MNSKSKSLRAIGATAVLATALTLSACGSDSSSGASSSPSPTTPTVTDATVVEPMGEMTAMFGTVSNPSSSDITLTGCSSAVATQCQIHEVIKQGNVDKMQQVPDGLTVPANGSVTLKSGGYHVMLMGLTQKLAIGQNVGVTLTFSTGDVSVMAPVTSRTATASPGM